MAPALVVAVYATLVWFEQTLAGPLMTGFAGVAYTVAQREVLFMQPLLEVTQSEPEVNPEAVENVMAFVPCPVVTVKPDGGVHW